jgi:hypothetical protein
MKIISKTMSKEKEKEHTLPGTVLSPKPKTAQRSKSTKR